MILLWKQTGFSSQEISLPQNFSILAPAPATVVAVLLPLSTPELPGGWGMKDTREGEERFKKN